jgi:hypothetical protein
MARLYQLAGSVNVSWKTISFPKQKKLLELEKQGYDLPSTRTLTRPGHGFFSTKDRQ